MMSTALSLPVTIGATFGSRTTGFARATVRIARLVSSAAVRFVVWKTGDLVTASRPAARRDWRTACVQRWAQAATKATGVRLHVQGTAPSAPFLLVSNHLGYLDILVLASLVKGRFVARHDIGNWPLIGRLVHAGGTILVQRDRRADAAAASASMRDALDEGSGIILFPEGTSTPGSHVLPFRSSLFEPAVELQQSVHAAALHYATPEHWPAASESVCWWGDMTFGPHLWTMLQLPWIDAFVGFDETPVIGSDRKQLSASAHERVVALHASLSKEVA